MRSISCAIISLTLFYMAVNINKKYEVIRGLFALVSVVMIVISTVLMIFKI